MIQGIPLDSALARSLDTRLAHGWSHQEELLAVVAELIDLSNRQFAAANSKKGAQLPKPIFIPRPGRVVTKRSATPEELSVMFGKKGIIVRPKKRGTK